MTAAGMQFGVIITGGPVHEQIGLARAAEDAGWDGVFTWDGIHVGDEMDTYDPWVLLAAFALATSRVRLGAIISPLSRRRPWKVARETTTVDHLSRGRLVLPVGLGALDDRGFGAVGEETDRRVRAERLDETLEILRGLWTGEPFAWQGRHYRFPAMAFRPTPIQRPGIPIWVVGGWPSERSMSRALRHDGVLPNYRPPTGQPDGPIPAPVVREIRDWLDERSPDRCIEIVIEGTTPADREKASAQVGPYADAGATWWIESDWDTFDVESARRRIAAGPPRMAQPRNQ